MNAVSLSRDQCITDCRSFIGAKCASTDSPVSCAQLAALQDTYSRGEKRMLPADAPDIRALQSRLAHLSWTAPEFADYNREISISLVAPKEPDEGESTFRVAGKHVFACYDSASILARPSLFERLSEQERFQLIIHGLTIVIGMEKIDALRVTQTELETVFDYLIALNAARPGWGVTEHQKRKLLAIAREQAESGDYSTSYARALDALDILPEVSRQVKYNALDILGSVRASNAIRKERSAASRGHQDRHSLEETLNEIWSSIIATTRPIKIVLISFGSPWHHALWNILSVEAIKGDLEGVFGHEVDVRIMRAVLDPEVDRVAHKLLADEPDIWGLSIELGTLNAVDRLLDIVVTHQWKKKPLIVLGNQVPTYFPERFLNDPRLVDAVVCLHEGELAMRGIVEFVKGERSLEKISNLVFRDRTFGRLRRTPLENADTRLLVHSPSLDTCRSGITNMIQASRGCIFGCTYCTRWNSWNASRKVDAAGEVEEPGADTKWRPFELSRVVENIERFVINGITEIEFCDDEFFGGFTRRVLDRVNQFCLAMERLREKYQVQIAFRLFTTPLIVARSSDTEKARRQNQEVLEALQRLKRVGLVRVYIGLESGDMNQKKRYARRENTNDTIMALNILRQLGLEIDVGFIMFDPYLTVEEMLNNVRFFRDNGLVRHNTWPFRPLVVNEGTVMQRQLEKDGLLTGERDPDFLAYAYRFKNEEIGIIAEEVQTIARESMPIFYTLKTISKAHWERVENSPTAFAQGVVEENALVYLDFIENLGNNWRHLYDENRMAKVRRRVRSKILNLIDATIEKIDEGLFDQFEYDKVVLIRHLIMFWSKHGALYKAAVGYRLDLLAAHGDNVDAATDDVFVGNDL